MKINLVADYRGHLTGERYYRAGVLEVGKDIPEGDAAALVQAGRAVEIEAVRADAPDAPAPAGKRKARHGAL